MALSAIALVVAIVVVVDVIPWIKRPSVSGDMRGGKYSALLRSRYFWSGFCLAVPIAICLNLIPYGFSYGTYGTDGFEVAGWPFDFWVCGGDTPVIHFDWLYFLLDVLVAIVIAAATGISFRDGVGPFFERACTLFRRVHARRPEDDS